MKPMQATEVTAVTMPRRSGEELLTPEEAAALLGVEPHTIAYWRREGRLAAIVYGRVVRYRRIDVEAFRDDHRTRRRA